IADYLLLWSKPVGIVGKAQEPPTSAEIRETTRRLGVPNLDAAAAALIRQKGCAACHPGLGPVTPIDVPLRVADDSRGCLSGRSVPRFAVDTSMQKTIAAYRAVAGQEKHISAFTTRQRRIEHLGCLHCHQRDSDRSPPIEAIGSTLGSAWLQEVPFQ